MHTVYWLYSSSSRLYIDVSAADTIVLELAFGIAAGVVDFD